MKNRISQLCRKQNRNLFMGTPHWDNHMKSYFMTCNLQVIIYCTLMIKKIYKYSIQAKRKDESEKPNKLIFKPN